MEQRIAIAHDGDMNSLLDPARELLFDPFVLISSAAASLFLLTGTAARVIDGLGRRPVLHLHRTARQSVTNGS
jgi:hypothetical protein